MTKEMIENSIIKGINDFVAPEAEAIIKHTLKNNGCIKTGLMIKPLQLENTVVPILYIDAFIESIEEGRNSVQNVIAQILSIYNNNNLGNLYDSSLDNVADIVLNSLYVATHVENKLVNAEMNKELLKTVPHKKFLDLAIIYNIIIDTTDDEVKSICVTNELLDKIGMSLDELDSWAYQNTEANSNFEINDIFSVLAKTINVSKEEMIMNTLGCPYEVAANFNDYYSELEYVATNKRKVNGANILLYKQVLKSFAEYVNSDLVILPSSIHECILVTGIDPNDYYGLTNMVTDINKEELAQEDILSNNVYIYNRTEDSIKIASK